MGNRIVHFEIPAGDVEKLSRFYSDLFEWKFSKQSLGSMDYWMIQTTGTGPEHLAGGMYTKQEETDKPRFFVYVDDIDSHAEKLKQAGGRVIYEKQELPGMGWSLLAADPENNLLGLFQPNAPPAPKKAAPKKTAPKKKARPKKKSRKK